MTLTDRELIETYLSVWKSVMTSERLGHSGTAIRSSEKADELGSLLKARGYDPQDIQDLKRRVA